MFDMTLDQAVALIASIGTCAAAIATFWTVREMAKQRQTSYRPELVLQAIYFKGSPDIENGFPFNWRRNSDVDENAKVARFTIPLSNIGLGAAKNVRVLWSWPIQEVVSLSNELATKIEAKLYLKYNNEIEMLEVKSDTKMQLAVSWGNQKLQIIDYILSAATPHDSVMIEIPFAYVTTVSGLLFFWQSAEQQKKSPAKTHFPSIPPLTVNICYLDITNNEHNTLFHLNFELVMLSASSFYAHLEPKSVRRSSNL
jgi:hypothetical protein